jgi:hypothetical protein
MDARQRAASRLADADLLELTRLFVVHAITRGAAHALNNALTSLAGGIDAGAEPELIERELQRCTQIARSLVAGHGLRFGTSGEADLAAHVRQVAAVLGDTLGSRFEVAFERRDESLFVEADPARLELLALVLGFRLAGATRLGGGLRIAVGAGEKPQTASIELELSAGDVPPDAADRLLDPAAAGDAGLALALESATRTVADARGSLAARARDGGVSVCASFPTLEA